MNLNTVIEQFLLHQKKLNKKENTLKNYKTDLVCFVEFLNLKEILVDTSILQLSLLLEYGQYLSSRFKSDNSRRRRVQTLRIFFDYLVSNGQVKENYVRQVPVSPKFVDIPKPTPLVDIQIIWKHLSITKTFSSNLEELIFFRNQIIFHLILTAGLKVAELSQLRQDQIVSGAHPRVIIFPKKGDTYSIPLLPSFNQIFIRYKKLLTEAQETQNVHFNELLFYANPYKIISGGLSARGLELLFKDIRSRLDITLFTPKSLRMACIYNWIHQRHRDESIKTWLGVAPSYSLKIYHNNKNDHIYSLGFL
jgi:site-specific recombinase XerD